MSNAKRHYRVDVSISRDDEPGGTCLRIGWPGATREDVESEVLSMLCEYGAIVLGGSEELAPSHVPVDWVQFGRDLDDYCEECDDDE